MRRLCPALPLPPVALVAAVTLTALAIGCSSDDGRSDDNGGADAGALDGGGADMGGDEDASGGDDAGTTDDAGTADDAGGADDAGDDAGTADDAGGADDAGTTDDAGGDDDAGTAGDAGGDDDAGTAGDAGTTDDAGGEDGGSGPACGDGVLDDIEGCDDGGNDDGDGCDKDCLVEPGYDCDEASPTVCEPVCGDGSVVGTEQCDDGGTDAGDGCDGSCAIEPGYGCTGEPSMCATACGDGVPAGLEQCDDGNEVDGDGCSKACEPEVGFLCDAATPTACEEDCGDGLIVGDEVCDGGGGQAGDGCAACKAFASGWTCEGEPSVCGTVCGDGVEVMGVEACDDGNGVDGDGCSAACQLELGYECGGAPYTCEKTDVPLQLVLGQKHGCYRTSKGNAVCWGENAQGEVGVGNTDETYSPVLVSLPEAIVDIAAAEHANCAVTVGKKLYCWGDNDSKQQGTSGLSTSTNVETPAEVVALSGVVDVAAGEDHFCALLDTGAMRCWGEADGSQLGKKGLTTSDQDVPVDVELPGGAVVTKMALGGDHSCVLTDAGQVWCWGDVDNGQVGEGTKSSSSLKDIDVPTLVGKLAGEFISDICAGGDFTCATSAGGKAWCWGDNDDGQLGDGGDDDQAEPVAVMLPVSVTAAAVSCGWDHACLLDTNGSVWCWGEGDDAQLGNGTTTGTTVPGAVQGLPGPMSAIVASAQNSCAMTSQGDRYCWGETEHGDLGLSLEPLRMLPDGVVQLPVAGTPIDVATEWQEFRPTMCAVQADKTLACWGSGDEQIFFGPLAGRDHPVPAQLPGLAGVEEVELGDRFACVRTSTEVLCWGDNSDKQLGQGDSTVDFDVPTAPLGVDGTQVIQLEAGDDFMLAVLDNGGVYVWGDNDNKQLGLGGTSTSDVGTPTLNPTLKDVVAVSAGQEHACAIDQGSGLWCWGDDNDGQVGNDAEKLDQALPQPILSIGKVAEVACGEDHTCALDMNGDVYCWGDAGYGQLGDGQDDVDVAVPQKVNLPAKVQHVRVGNNLTCVLFVNGARSCWGYGNDGQLVNGGTTVDNPTPQPFLFLGPVADLHPGNSATLLQTPDGNLHAVGFLGWGTPGDGSTLRPLTAMKAKY
jgi:cysteine-rich repeat protein